MRVFAYGDFVGDIAQRHGVQHVRTHQELAEVLRA
jgi:hypothetical protein